jgi:hypothetical protein|tara:strand:+ start:1567 stop:2532 length:966 start_codon:yes stop_codon:yes gene_type:complete
MTSESNPDDLASNLKPELVDDTAETVCLAIEELNELLSAQISAQLTDTEKLVEAFQQHVASFAADYASLQQTAPEEAERGRKMIIDMMRSTMTPYNLKTLHNYQYKKDALFYRDLLREAGAMTMEEPEFSRQATITLGGWRRRQEDDTQAVIDDMLEFHPSLQALPVQRSSLEYEISQAFKKTGNIEDAAKWMERSGLSAEIGGDEDKGRMARAEALKWRDEMEPGSQRDALLALEEEFTKRATHGLTPEIRDEAERWRQNVICFRARAAEYLNDAEELEACLRVLDTPENIESGWSLQDEMARMNDKLRELKPDSDQLSE